MTDLFAPAGVEQRLLLYLTLTVLALLVLAVAFGASAIVLRLQTERRDRRWKTLSARWEQPVLEALADPDRIDAVHALVPPTRRLHFVRFVLEYSRRIHGTERVVLKSLAEPYLQPLTLRAQSKKREIRTRAIGTLGALGLPRYAPEVLTALDDPSPLVAMVAAWSLCREGDPEYAPAILRRLTRFEGWNRRFLASMLATMGPGGAAALRTSLGATSEEPWVRTVAAEALRVLGDFESATEAAQVVGDEEDSELVAAALRLLTAVGTPEHAEVIRVRCASPDPILRAHAVSALGALGNEADRKRLFAATADPSPWVAMRAAQGLATSGGVSLLRDLRASDHPGATVAQQVLQQEGTE